MPAAALHAQCGVRIFGDGLDRDPANLPQRRPAQHGTRAAEEAGIPKIIPILHKAVEQFALIRNLAKLS